MTDDRPARLAYGLPALAVLAGVVVRVCVSVRLTRLFLIVYMIFTAVRGPFAHDSDRYPLTNVKALADVRVAANALWVSLLFLALAKAAVAVDRRLPGHTP